MRFTVIRAAVVTAALTGLVLLLVTVGRPVRGACHRTCSQPSARLTEPRCRLCLSCQVYWSLTSERVFAFARAGGDSVPSLALLPRTPPPDLEMAPERGERSPEDFKLTPELVRVRAATRGFSFSPG
jgi:hypothetical protein